MATLAPPSASALALREYFGDRRPPNISRKITACVACRKLKIKCHMQNSKPPCTRCSKRGLSCTINRSLQMLLENEATWKQTIDQKLVLVEEAIGRIADRLAMPELRDTMHISAEKSDTVDEDVDCQGKEMDTVVLPSQTQVAWEVVVDAKCNPAAIPATCILEVPAASPSNQLLKSQPTDLITRGSISLNTAEHYFKVYHERLDHFVYRILIERDSLSSIRASSALLTAAICAVAALHAGQSEYEICYKEFMREYSTQMISKGHGLDDVRGLCIAAFWLSDMSWALSGAAVRIAIELGLHRGVTKNLHRCVTKSPAEQKLCYIRTRLYLQVYVCDHHFSIAYGRSPMTRDFTALSSPQSFLELECTTEDDRRLVAQVELWTTTSRIYDNFGVNTDIPVPATLVSEFWRLGAALEAWRADYSGKLAYNRHIGNYPKLGVGLHFHFAKLYLCTHAFRGFSSSENVVVPFEMVELADAAVYSAGSILRAVVTNEEIQSQLNGLPTYFGTMVASAAVFLLKMTIKSPTNTRIDKAETIKLLGQLAEALKNVTSRMHSQHVLSHISLSISKLVDQPHFSAPQNPNPHFECPVESGLDVTQYSTDRLTLEDSLFLESFDLMYGQDGGFSLDGVGFE